MEGFRECLKGFKDQGQAWITGALRLESSATPQFVNVKKKKKKKKKGKQNKATLSITQHLIPLASIGDLILGLGMRLLK